MLADACVVVALGLVARVVAGERALDRFARVPACRLAVDAGCSRRREAVLAETETSRYRIRALSGTK